MNFLQISEPEAASLNAQSEATRTNTRLKRQSTNALVAQYGDVAADPAAWGQAVNASTDQQLAPSKVQGAELDNQTKQTGLDAAHLQLRQRAVLAAAQAMKSAIDGGADPGKAFDTIVAPNAATLGLTADEAPTLRQQLTANPKAIDAIINGLAGPAKPDGGPQYYRLPDGSMGEGVLDERGQFHVVPLPEGAQPLGPMGFSGAPQVTQLPDGTWAMSALTKTGQMVTVPMSGTPTAGMNAQTGAFRAGVTANNSEYGAAPGTSLPTVGGASLAVRNNNPGNLRPPPGGKWAGQTGVDENGFAVFSSPGAGKLAAEQNLIAKQTKHGLTTLSQIIGDPKFGWAPASDGNDPAAYAAAVGKAVGIDPNAKIDLVRNPGLRQRVLQAMYGVEGGTGQQGPSQGGKVAFDLLPPKGRQGALDQAQHLVNGAQQLASIDDQLNNVERMVSPLSVGLASVTSRIPGTPAHDMQAALTTLRSQGLTAWIQSMKNASGSTGMGRILQSEATAAMSAFGNLEHSQSESQFRYHLGIFKQRVHQLQGTAEQAFKQEYGTDPYAALGVDNPAGGGASSSAGGWRVVGVK